MRSPSNVGRAVLAMACMTFLACAARGDETPADEHGHGSAAAPHEAAHEEGHHPNTIHGEPPKNYFGPKTEFLYWSPQLFIWTMLLFLPLWYILNWFVWGPMVRGIEERDRKMAESLSMAKKLRDEAKSISFEQDADAILAQQEARELLDKARTEAAVDVNEILTKAREESSQSQRAARQEIERATQEGLREIEQSSRELGNQIARNLIRQAGGSS